MKFAIKLRYREIARSLASWTDFTEWRRSARSIFERLLKNQSITKTASSFSIWHSAAAQHISRQRNIVKLTRFAAKLRYSSAFGVFGSWRLFLQRRRDARALFLLNASRIGKARQRKRFIAWRIFAAACAMTATPLLLSPGAQSPGATTSPTAAPATAHWRDFLLKRLLSRMIKAQMRSKFNDWRIHSALKDLAMRLSPIKSPGGATTPATPTKLQGISSDGTQKLQLQRRSKSLPMKKKASPKVSADERHQRVLDMINAHPAVATPPKKTGKAQPPAGAPKAPQSSKEGRQLFLWEQGQSEQKEQQQQAPPQPQPQPQPQSASSEKRNSPRRTPTAAERHARHRLRTFDSRDV